MGKHKKNTKKLPKLEKSPITTRSKSNSVKEQKIEPIPARITRSKRDDFPQRPITVELKRVKLNSVKEQEIAPIPARITCSKLPKPMKKIQQQAPVVESTKLVKRFEFIKAESFKVNDIVLAK